MDACRRHSKVYVWRVPRLHHCRCECKLWALTSYQHLLYFCPLDYPSFKRMCGVISPCCQMQYMEPLKQSIGEFTKLAEKKLTETMFQLLHEKTMNSKQIASWLLNSGLFKVESSMKNMKSTPMILVSMDADDNTDIIFNRPSQKIPIEKKHPTYINAVMPPKVSCTHLKSTRQTNHRKLTMSINWKTKYSAKR